MARVGIGVPVYNGGELLRQSLECLRTQSFEDLEILLGDNASADETADICAEFANKDSRFRHIRRPHNLGPLPNFADLRRQSAAPLFMWRAHDDLSAPNFVEELVNCFDRDPNIDLAVCDVKVEIDSKAKPRRHGFQQGPASPRILGVAHRLMRSHASWIYGLWSNERLGRSQDLVMTAYPHLWGWDHLCLMPTLLEGRVGGTDATEFCQRIFHGQSTRAERQAQRPGVKEMTQLRADFADVVRQIVGTYKWSSAERLALGLILPIYIDRRGYSRLKLLRRRWRRR